MWCGVLCCGHLASQLLHSTIHRTASPCPPGEQSACPAPRVTCRCSGQPVQGSAPGDSRSAHTSLWQQPTTSEATVNLLKFTSHQIHIVNSQTFSTATRLSVCTFSLSTALCAGHDASALCLMHLVYRVPHIKNRLWHAHSSYVAGQIHSPCPFSWQYRSASSATEPPVCSPKQLSAITCSIGVSQMADQKPHATEGSCFALRDA